MADEQTTEQPQKTAEEAGQIPAADSGRTPETPEAGNTEKPLFTQSDLDRLIRERLAEQRARNERALQQEKDLAEQARLKEQGEFKLLAEKYQAELEELRGEVSRKDRDALCARIAAEAKLPADLASRLVGETEAELKADAEAMARHLAPPKAPDLDMREREGGKGGKPSVEQRKQELLKSGEYTAF